MKSSDIHIICKKPLSEFQQLVFNENIYFHYNLYEDGTGFEFICFQQDDPEHDEIEMIVNGSAYFDGIRHLYFGDEKSDNCGYFNYPNLSVLSDVMNLLKELKVKHCSYI